MFRRRQPPDDPQPRPAEPARDETGGAPAGPTAPPEPPSGPWSGFRVVSVLATGVFALAIGGSMVAGGLGGSDDVTRPVEDRPSFDDPPSGGAPPYPAPPDEGPSFARPAPPPPPRSGVAEPNLVGGDAAHGLFRGFVSAERGFVFLDLWHRATGSSLHQTWEDGSCRGPLFLVDRAADETRYQFTPRRGPCPPAVVSVWPEDAADAVTISLDTALGAAEGELPLAFAD